jgi:hypothetical protein
MNVQKQYQTDGTEATGEKLVEAIIVDLDILADEIGKDLRCSRILSRGSLFRWGEHYERIERMRWGLEALKKEMAK